jgi:hypothetical protein
LGTAIPIAIPIISVTALAWIKHHGGIQSFAAKPVVLRDTVTAG